MASIFKYEDAHKWLEDCIEKGKKIDTPPEWAYAKRDDLFSIIPLLLTWYTSLCIAEDYMDMPINEIATSIRKGRDPLVPRDIETVFESIENEVESLIEPFTSSNKYMRTKLKSMKTVACKRRLGQFFLIYEDRI